MDIRTIHYKRVKNLGNYENETLEAFADLTEEDHIEDAIAELRDTVLRGLSICENESEDDF